MPQVTYKLWMGQAVLGHLQQIHIGSTEFLTCSGIVLVNQKTKLGALFHYPARALLKPEHKDEAKEVLDALVSRLKLKQGEATCGLMLGPDNFESVEKAPDGMDMGMGLGVDKFAKYAKLDEDEEEVKSETEEELEALKDYFFTHGLRTGRLKPARAIYIGFEGSQFFVRTAIPRGYEDLRKEKGSAFGKEMQLHSGLKSFLYGRDIDWELDQKLVKSKIEKGKVDEEEDDDLYGSGDGKGGFW